MGQHTPQDPAGNGTVQAGAVGSPIRLGKHTCLIRVRKPPLRIIVWETLLIQSAVQIHDVLGFISQGVPPILISIFKRANFSLFGTILKIVDFECFFGFQRGHPTKWTFPWFYHEISSGVCFLKISCCMIQHVPSHVHCANSRRWKRMTRHQRGPQRTIHEFFLEEFLILSYGSWLCFYGRNLSKTF